MSRYGRLQERMWERLIEADDAPLKDLPPKTASKAVDVAVEVAWDFFQVGERDSVEWGGFELPPDTTQVV